MHFLTKSFRTPSFSIEQVKMDSMLINFTKLVMVIDLLSLLFWLNLTKLLADILPCHGRLTGSGTQTPSANLFSLTLVLGKSILWKIRRRQSGVVERMDHHLVILTYKFQTRLSTIQIAARISPTATTTETTQTRQEQPNYSAAQKMGTSG